MFLGCNNRIPETPSALHLDSNVPQPTGAKDGGGGAKGDGLASLKILEGLR